MTRKATQHSVAQDGFVTSSQQDQPIMWVTDLENSHHQDVSWRLSGSRSASVSGRVAGLRALPVRLLR